MVDLKNAIEVAACTVVESSRYNGNFVKIITSLVQRAITPEMRIADPSDTSIFGGVHFSGDIIAEIFHDHVKNFIGNTFKHLPVTFWRDRCVVGAAKTTSLLGRARSVPRAMVC